MSAAMNDTVLRVLPLIACVALFVLACILVGRAADSERRANLRASDLRHRALRRRYAKNLVRKRRAYHW